MEWVQRDGKLIILARGLRTFVQGAVSVLLAIYLDGMGFTLVQIGALLSIGIAGSAVLTSVVSLVAERLGRRRLIVFFTTLMGSSLLALILSKSFIVLALFAFFGGLFGGEGAGAGGPIQPLEQASLTETVSQRRRTDLFALYGIVATTGTALGALAAGAPVFLQNTFELEAGSAYRFVFGGFLVVLCFSALLYASLSARIEVSGGNRQWTNPLKLPSRRIIFTLTGLFSVDRFAGSLMVRSLVAYWFATRFGIQLGSIAVIFFFSSILTAVSLWLSAKIASRIGLIRTMVFTHIPASLVFITIPLVPAVWMAVALWQLRAFLGMMDVPVRDSYTMAVVKPEERVAMAGIHNVGRSASATIGPSVSTALWNAISASVPFIACGVIKIAYNVTLYFMFRHIKPPEERVSAESQMNGL
jgi:MFS family permease